MKIKSLKDLRDYLNTLNDEQLERDAIVNGFDEFSYSITGARETEEDRFGDDDGTYPVSDFEPDGPEDKLENYDFYPKGTVYLYCNEEDKPETEADPY